jgi:hypothetical protein
MGIGCGGDRRTTVPLMLTRLPAQFSVGSPATAMEYESF